LDLITVDQGAALTAGVPTILGVPDDWAWVVKFGALADVLSLDGLAADPARAAYAKARWEQGVQQARTAAVVLTDTSVTRFALHGMTEQSASALAPLARSWRQPPPLSVATPGYSSADWSVAERAYLVSRIVSDPTPAAPLVLTFAASADHPLVRPGLVIRNWGDAGCAITRDGQPLVADRDFRIGKLSTPTGTDLVVWLDLSADSPTRLVVSPR
jgi:hypothetical protein